MADTARGLWVREAGGWRRVRADEDGQAGFWVRVAGAWKKVASGFVRVDGTWKQFYPTDDDPEPPPSCPSPGTYILNATSLYLPTTGGVGGYAEFDTSDFQVSGCIKEIRIRVGWGNFTTNGITFPVAGRPNGNHYRTISSDSSWANSTIDHRIDTFDASSLTDFNSGLATGFTLSAPSSSSLGIMWNTVQLSLTT